MRSCSTCKESKPLEEFAWKNRAKNHRRYRCKTCQAIDDRARYESDKERQRARAGEYRAKNTSRVSVKVPSEKCCGTCEQVKASSEFYRNRQRKDGLMHQCKQCRKAGVTHRYPHTDGVLVLSGVKRQGLFDALEDKACAICQTELTLTTAMLDHCHDTGVVRGFLCGPCNRGIGLLQDSSEVIERARDYLARFGK